MRLVIGNKNYSSWSMRPWVLLTHFAIPFEEQRVRFDAFGPESAFKRTVAPLSPTATVPILVLDDGFAVWDSLAIAETVAERFPAHAIWPREANARARARSVCAEMHGGFRALRNHFPMNVEASLPEVGARVLAAEADLRADLARVVALFQDALAGSGSPFLFGEFGAADAYFAPVVLRLRTYAAPVPEDVAAYMDRVVASPGVAAWIRGALAERDFRDFEEPYRTSRD
jgi:glutathione S-transferase